MEKILSLILRHPKKLFKAISIAFIAFLIAFSINTYKQNKTLSNALETALNNIEAYLGSLLGSLLANNVLKLTVDELLNYNDLLVKLIDSVKNQLKIKSKLVNTAATQTLVIDVNGGKGVDGDLTAILKDTTYSDTIYYNPLTSAYYTISRDSVNIGLSIHNTQYLFVYSTKEYKNKKCWFKRLITFDWKKVTKNKYVIQNTNDLITTDSVRVIQIY